MTSEVPSQRQQSTPRVLPPGTRLEEFELRDVVGVGGFGIVYLAFDHSLEREVAVKEYMPASLVGRTETLHVSLRSESDAENFSLGLKSFINEARLLARFDHPALLKVLRYWEANGTAYMAMPVLRGQTLKAMRLAQVEPPAEASIRSLLVSLADGLQHLHAAGVYHRDVSPDNIQVEPDGHAVLLDFGAARRVLTDKSQNLTAILKPAYAPIEQYGEAGSVKQGPWTDLYALGATMHFLLTGRPPAPATVRALHDEALPLSEQQLPGYSQQLLRTVDWMLEPRPADRPQSVAALQAALAGVTEPPARKRSALFSEPGPDPDETVLLPRSGRTQQQFPSTTRLDPAASPAAEPRQQPAASTLAAAGSAQGSRSGAGASRVPLVIAGGIAVAVLLGGLVWWGSQPSRDMHDTTAPAAAIVQAPAQPAPGQVATPAATPAATPLEPAAATVPAASAALPTPAPTGAANSTANTAVLPAASPGSAQLPQGAGAVPVKPADARTQLAAQRPPPPPRKPAETRPSPAPVVEERPREPVAAPPAVLPAPPPAVVPAPVVEAPKPPEGPVAICKKKDNMPSFVCIERECLRKSFAQHPDCVKWRANVPRENNN